MFRTLERLAIGAAIAAIASAGLAVAPAQAEDRRVEIVNDTSLTLVEFYASNASRTSWEEDILGRNVIASGGSAVIDIDDGTDACLFDFKAVFTGGQELVREDIDVCSITTYTYTD